MRGYFAVGIEGLDKPLNAGTLFRSAHAFGASYAFTVGAEFSGARNAATDTSDTPSSMPFFAYPGAEALTVPVGGELVGLEIADDAETFPPLYHPRGAVYLFARWGERLSPALAGRCRRVLRLPARLCLNLAMAGVMVMYDRVATLGQYPPRPLKPGGPDGDYQNIRDVQARFRA